MKHNFSIMGLLVAMGAIGGPQMASDLPSSPKRRTPRMFTGRSLAQKERFEKRVVKDLSAAQMNYKGWCGRQEAGSLVA